MMKDVSNFDFRTIPKTGASREVERRTFFPGIPNICFFQFPTAPFGGLRHYGNRNRDLPEFSRKSELRRSYGRNSQPRR